jgi:hypothetical protein
MSSQLLAALGGAIVGFCGTGLLQAARNRRDDRDGVRGRLAVTRGLKVELAEAGMHIDIALQTGFVVTAFRYPVAVWEAEGHHLLAALDPGAALKLVAAFGRLRSTNALMAGAPDTAISLDSGFGLGAKDLEKLQEHVRIAMGVLNALDEHYTVRERELSTPRMRAAWRRLARR